MLPVLDDAEAMAVHGDLLQERGDPRGELVQLHLAQERAPYDGRLALATQRHLALHAKALLGPMSLHQSVAAFSWKRGYVVAASLRSQAWLPERTQPRLTVVEPVNRLARATRDLGRLPGRDHLRHLTLEQPFSRVVFAHMTQTLRALRETDLRLEGLRVRAPGEVWRWGVAESAGEELGLVIDGVAVRCDERLADVVRGVLWKRRGS